MKQPGTNAFVAKRLWFASGLSETEEWVDRTNWSILSQTCIKLRVWIHANLAYWLFSPLQTEPKMPKLFNYVFSYFFTSSSRVIASPHFSAFKVSLSSEPSENHASSKRHSIASRRSAKISENMPLRSYRFVETKKKQYSNIHLIIYKEFHIAKSGSKRSFPSWNSGMTGSFSHFCFPAWSQASSPKNFRQAKKLEWTSRTSNLKLFSEKEKGEDPWVVTLDIIHPLLLAFVFFCQGEKDGSCTAAISSCQWIITQDCARQTPCNLYIAV